MNAIDLAFIVMVVYGLVKGNSQGLIGSVLGLFQFILALIFALRFSYIGSNILARNSPVPADIAPVVAFIGTFLGLLFTFFIIGLILKNFMRATHLTSLNRGLGVILWIFILTMGFGLLVNLSDKGGLLPESIKNDSKVYGVVAPMAEVMACRLGFVVPATGTLVEAVGNSAAKMRENALNGCENPQ